MVGLGRIGCVTAACLASLGHRVHGVDVDPEKVRSIHGGEPPFHEHGLGALLKRVLANGRLSVSTSLAPALRVSSTALICVGTDGLASGRPDLSALLQVIDDIRAIHRAGGFSGVLVIRSTILPGTSEGVLKPRLSDTSLQLAINPEFLREGSAVQDLLNPALIVIGAEDRQVTAQIARLYATFPCRCRSTSLCEAEMIKYACNAFHALKIAFANEVGSVCSALGVDGNRVMDALSSDTRLNTSGAYLRPGFAFGGYCLPKDTRALNACAQDLGVELPLLQSILPSNAKHLSRAVDMVMDHGHGVVGVFGLSFKTGTGDLRESPAVDLANELLMRGRDVRLYDPLIHPKQLAGAQSHLPPNLRPSVSRSFAAWLKSIGCMVLTQEPDTGTLATLRQNGMPILNLSGASIYSSPGQPLLSGAQP